MSWSSHSLLSRFYRAHCAFQSTSTSSERVFSAENLIVSESRKSLCPERAESLLITRDYLKRRQNTDAYRLCEKCPLLPSKNASYVIIVVVTTKLQFMLQIRNLVYWYTYCSLSIFSCSNFCVTMNKT